MSFGVFRRRSWPRPKRRRYVQSAPRAYYLVADHGAFTLAGQAVTLRVGHVVQAGAGSHALAGQDARLVFGQSVSLSVVGHELYGQFVNLIAHRRLVLGHGAHVLSGQTVNLTKGFTITPAAGAYVLSGQQVTLRAVRKLYPDAGSYLLAGQETYLRADRIVHAGAGSYDLVGQATDFVIYPWPVYRVRMFYSPSSVVDLTDSVLEASWERSLARFDRGLEAGLADIVVTNDLGELSPLRVQSGMLRPNIAVLIEAAASSATGYSTMFSGYVDRISVQPALAGPRNIVLSCRDRMKELSRRRVDTAIQTEVNVGSLVALVLESADITAHSIDLIGDELPFAWFNAVQVTTALAEIISAGGYSAYVSGDGTLRVRDRYFDLGGTVVASYDTYRGLSFELSEENVVNRVRVSGTPRTIVASLQVVASITKPVRLGAGESIGFFLAYQDPRNQDTAPAVNVVTPVASEDWQVNAQSDGLGADLTAATTLQFFAFAETAVATVTNVGTATAYLTLFNVRGNPIQSDDAVSVIVDQIESQSLYGIKEGALETRLFGTTDRLTARATDILDLFGLPAPKVTMALLNRWPDVMTNDLTDIVALTEEHTGISGQFTVQAVRHQLNAAERGWAHMVDYELEESKAIAELILDDDDFGILDTNRLGRTTMA